VYCSDDLRHLRFYGLFGILYLFDPLVTLLGHVGQIVLEAHHAVVDAAVRVLLNAVLLSNLPRLIFALSVRIAKVVHCVAPLIG
jgi:hypothetical protein